MASSVSQRRTGTVLPPPGDDFSHSAVVSAKHTFKNGTLVCSLCWKFKLTFHSF
jgi:CCR4-NOT transcription complex subunit 4